MLIYHKNIFVLYIIHQNNPVSKWLCCIIPWFLRNRSYCRRAPSYRRHLIKLPTSVISDKFAYRRLAANLSGIIVQKREKAQICRFGTRCTMPPCQFSGVNLREIGGCNEARAGKNFPKRAAASAPSWRQYLGAVAPSEIDTFSSLLAICAGNSPVIGEFPAQRPVTRSFDVFLDLRLNQRLSKQSWGWWFETPSCPLWRHSNAECCIYASVI